MMHNLPGILLFKLVQNKSFNRLLFCYFIAFFVILTCSVSYSQVNSVPAGGNWGTPATWVGGVVPTAGQSVVITGGTVTINYNTPLYNNITVNPGATLVTFNSSTSTLNYSGNMVVSGNLNNQGGINQTTNGKLFQLNGNGTYTHTPFNNTLNDESIFFRSTETFSNTSTITINKWFDLSIPLGDPTRVGLPCNFGNVTLNVSDTNSWEQDGCFMNANIAQRVFGTFTVSAGIVSMDNGGGVAPTSPSNFLILNAVMISNTGRIIFTSGINRNFTLTTGAFTDASTAPLPTIIMDNCFAPTIWNANGAVTIGHNFYGILGSGVSPFATYTMTVNGHLNINGGNVNFVSGAVCPTQITVIGNTNISGSPGMVRFLDGNNANLTFVTNHLNISGGTANTFMGGNYFLPHATGIPSFTINNDINITGTVSNTVFLDAPNSTQKIRVHVGGSVIINGVGSNLTIAKHKGAMTLNVTSNLTLTAGKFIGQIDTLSTGLDSVVVGGAFLMNTSQLSDYFRINYGEGNAVFRSTGAFTIQNTGPGQGIGFTGIYNGSGNMTFNALANFTLTAGRFYGIYNNKPNNPTGDLTFTTGINCQINGGTFRGIDNRTTPNAGVVNFTTGNLSYTAGNFSGYYSVHNAANISTFTMNGLLQITFAPVPAATDSFTFIGITEANAIVSNMRLGVNITGNFNITGGPGKFISSLARGKETISIGNQLNISGGQNSFNSSPGTNLPNPHPVYITITTDLSVNGGITYFSAHSDTLVASVGGNYSMTNGEFIVTAGNMPATLNINGGYTQSAGTFYLHKNTLDPSYNTINVAVNYDNNATGDFSHTGGVINFDNHPSSTQAYLTINSPIITYGGTGSMTMALPGTNSVSGVIYYGRAGTSTFNRTSATHSIQQVEQSILTGCTLVVATGNIQVASINVTPYFNSLIVNSGAVLDLQGNQLFSNILQAYSGIRISGKLRTSRAQGFYNGLTTAAINSQGAMTYLLLTNSVVEYYGTNIQEITGIGVGTATAIPHKYYNLEINNTGPANSTFAFPTNVPNNRSVFVRNKLILTAGELNLDNDHDPVSGGRAIIIERDSLSAITRTAGYIRSEVYDSSACVIWKVNSRVGAHVIPFGYNAGSYIPYIFNLTSGNADTLFVSTYHTIANDNLPFPPGVIHLHGLSGLDNSINTVNRFWFIRTTGVNPVADMNFMVTAAEMAPGITDPRAQAWIPLPIPGWQYPYQGFQTTSGAGTLMQGATYFPMNWWTLSGLLNPLPISLLDFNGSCKGEKTELKWSTATEVNNSYFTILQSRDGISYESIGTVPGAGTSNNVNNYSYTVPGIASTLNYYKLRQTDFDGMESEFGPVMTAACTKTRSLEVTVIPTNPEELSVIIKTPYAGNFDLSLYSMEGKPILSKSAGLDSGTNIVTLSTSGIASGVYVLKVQSTSEAFTTKVPVGFSR